MPVIYEVDREIGLIRTRCVGAVTFAEVIRHFRELEGDSSLPSRLDVLLDLRETESIPDGEQLSSVAREVELAGHRIEWGACAVVASRDVMFGMSRVFLVFAEAHFSRSNAFREIEEAERWLALLRSPPHSQGG